MRHIILSFSQSFVNHYMKTVSVFSCGYATTKKFPCKVSSPAGGCAFSCAGFIFLPKELFCGHPPVNGDLVVFLHLDPVNQLGDHQMLGFIAGILKAGGPGKHFVDLNFVGSLCILLCFQPGFGFFHCLGGGIIFHTVFAVLQASLFLF